MANQLGKEAEMESNSWLSIIRSVALIAVGIFLLVYETAIEDHPNNYIIGAGLIALGVSPLALHKLRNGNGGTK